MFDSEYRPDQSILGVSPPVYVIKSQLEESTQQTSQAFQQQFAAFTTELLHWIPPPQPAYFVAPPPSKYQPSATHPPPEAQLKSPPPLHDTYNGQLRSRVKHTSPPPRQTTHRADPHKGYSPYKEVTRESPNHGRDQRENTNIEAQLDPRRYRAAPGPSATYMASDYDQTYRTIAKAIRGNTPPTDDIMNTTNEKYKMPQIQKYKGEGDHAEHVQKTMT